MANWRNKSATWFTRVALILFAAMLIAGCSLAPKGPPNVVLITMDTTRPDYIGAFGAETANTPTLDALAAAGAIFKNTTTAAVATTPSHTSILSSKYAIQHGIYDNDALQPASLLTLPKILKSNGYTTAAFVSAIPVSRSLGFDRGFDFFDEWFDPELGGAERRAKNTTDSALKWLESNSGKPFFIWIHYYDPHMFYDPPEGYRNLFMPVDEVLNKCEKGIDEKQIAKMNRLRKKNRDISPEDRVIVLGGSDSGCDLPLAEAAPVQKALYAGEIAYMDHNIGRLVQWFREKRMYGNTLFVAVADHGEVLDEKGHGRNYKHGKVYEEVARVPLIIKLPGRHSRGVESDAPVCSIDILPTIIESLGAKVPPGAGFSGKSLLNLARGRKDASFENRPVYFEAPGRFAAGVKLGLMKYVYIYYPSKYFLYSTRKVPEELFDLKSDPKEKINFSGTRRAPEFKELMKMLKEWKEKTAVRGAENKPDKVKDREFQNKLRQLGYL